MIAFKEGQAERVCSTDEDCDLCEMDTEEQRGAARILLMFDSHGQKATVVLCRTCLATLLGLAAGEIHHRWGDE